MIKNNKEREEINKNLKLITKSSFVVFIGLFLSKILIYIYRIVVARYYGPEVYGLFSLAVMILSFFVAFFSFGFLDGLLRYIPWYRGKKENNKIKYLIKISAIILFFSGIFAAILLFFLSNFISINFFHNQNLIIFLKIFSFLIPIYIFANLFLAIIQAFEKIFWYSFILNVLQNGIKVLTLVLFIFLGFKTNAIIFSFFFGILSMFIVSYFVCRYKIPELFRKFYLKKQTKSKTIRKFFSYSWPLIFLAILGSIMMWIDSFAIGYFKSVLEVGLYNVAIPIILLLKFVPELFLQLFFPLVTKEFSKKNFIVVKELTQQIGKWIFIFNLPLFLIMFLFPGVIINMLFGAEYILAENALRILAVGTFIVNLIIISNTLLLAIGKSKLFLINTSITLIMNIILDILFVPKYGINGAAFTSTIINISLSIAVFFQIKHYTSINPIKKSVIKIAAVSIIPLCIILYIKTFITINFISVILLGTFFILSYFLLIFVTGCLDENDFMILKSLKNKIINR